MNQFNFNLPKLFTILIFSMFFSVFNLQATDIAPAASGNFNTPTTWNPAQVPGASDNIIIRSWDPIYNGNKTISLTGDHTIQAININHNIDVPLTFSSGDASPHTFNIGSINNSGSGVISLLIENNINVVVGSITNFSYCNITIKSGGSLTVTGNTTIGWHNASIVVENGGSATFSSNFTANASLLQIDEGSNVTFGGNVTIEQSTLTLDINDAINVPGNLIISNGSSFNIAEGSSLDVDGNMTITGGAGTYTVDGTLNVDGTLDVLYNTMEIEGSGSISADNFDGDGYIFGSDANEITDGATITPGDYEWPGDHTYIVPNGVTSITVECWGAGGAGGASTKNKKGGGGGGGGAYSKGIIAVTPGERIPVTVGAGGSASNGGSTTITATNGTLIANGGTAGTAGNNSSAGTGGAGGSASGGSIANNSGVAGANGGNTGGNGGDAANDADGNPGGAGGAGGTNSAGVDGGFPGGGGGGAEENANGGLGGDGKVIITPVPAPDAAVYFSTGSVDPNDVSNWTTNTDGTGTNPPDFTTGKQSFVIQAGHSMTTTADWTISGTESSLQISNGGTLVVEHTVDFAALYVNNGATYTHNINGGTLPTATWGAESTCNIIGITNTAPTNIDQSFGNFIWNSTGQSGNILLPFADGTTFNGSFTIESSGSNALVLANNTSVSLNIKHTLNVNGGVLDLSNGSAALSINLSGDINISGGTITESGSGAGNINLVGTTEQNFINSSGTISQTINFAVNNGAKLNMTNNIIAGSIGNFTLNAGASIKSGHIDGLNGNVQVSGTQIFNTNANYEFNYSGAGLQNTGAGFIGGNNVIIDAANGVILTSDATISGTLQLNCTLNANAKSLTLNGPTITGTPTNLTTNNTTNLIFGGTSSGVILPSSATSLNNLTINNSNGISLSNTLVLDGNLALNGGSLAIGDYNISVPGTITSSAGFDDAHMIATDGNGLLIKIGSVAADYQITYPVGSNAYYTPMTITTLNATITAGNIRVRAVSSRNPNLAYNYDGLLKYWDVATSGISNIEGSDFNFKYNANEIIGSDAAYEPYKWDGTAFVSPGNPTSAGANPFGTTDATITQMDGGWTAYDPVPKTTYYSYTNGNWIDPDTWTTDPSGALQVNTSDHIPGANDKVVIFSGRTITMTTNTISATSVSIEGILDLAATTGHSFDNIAGSGTIRISGADVFPSYFTNTLFTTDEGTVEYYGNGFELTTSRTINNLHVSLNNLQVLTFKATPYTVSGNLTINSGIFQINDDASDIPQNLIVEKNITVYPGASFTVGEGNTLNGPIDENATGNLQYYKAYNTVECYGNFVNNGTVRFTNQAAPVYNNFTYNGAVTFFMKGATNNTFDCKGITDLYNLVVDKGTDKSYKLTIYSTAEGNFRLFGRNNLEKNTASPFTEENPELRKALWIKNGTLELTGTMFIPSLTEGGGDYYIPANAKLWINGSGVKLWSTDRTEPGAVVGIAPNDIQGTGVRTTNDDKQSFSIYGDLQVSQGYFTTGSHGIVLWPQATTFGNILIEGGQCDIPGIRTAAGSSSGKFSLTQTDGLIKFLGSYGNEGLGNCASLCLLGTDCSFSMTGGTMKFYDGQTGTNGGIIRIESNSTNINVTGGTIEIIKDNANYNNQTINSTAPFYNLTLTGNAASPLDLSLSDEISILNDLTINDYSTLTTNNNNVSIGGNLTLGNTTTTNNAVYAAGTNTTIFNGDKNSIITITNTSIPAATGDDAPLNFHNLVIDKTLVTPASNAWSVTLNSPGRSEVSTDEENRLCDINNSLVINEGKYNYYRYKTRLKGNYTCTGTALGDASNTGRITLENGSGQFELSGSNATDHSFGDVELNDANGVKLNTNASFSSFILSSGIVDIGAYNMIITGTNGIIGSGFGTSKMIQTDGTTSSQGITVSLSLSGSYTNQDVSLIPVGVSGTLSGTGVKYTPQTININGDVGVGPYSGTVNVRPVDEYHPTSNPNSLSDLIPYYWKTSITGNLSDITSTMVNYSFFSSYSFNFGGGKKHVFYRNNDWTEVASASNPLVFATTGFENTDYSAGKKNAFRTVQHLYSKASSDWNLTTTWALLSHTGNSPTVLNDFDIYEIGGAGGVNHQVTVPAGVTAKSSKLIIQSKTATGIATGSAPSLIIAAGTSGHDFYAIEGGGRFVLNDATLPTGDFGDFCLNDEAIFEYSGGTYEIPATLTSYPNLHISGNASSIKTLPEVDIVVRKNLNIYDASNSGVALYMNDGEYGNVTINENLVLSNNAKFILPNTDDIKTVTILKNIDCESIDAASTNSIEIKAGGAFSTPTHKLKVQGDINIGASSLTLWRSNTFKSVDLEFYGDTDTRIYASSSNDKIVLANLTINKSTDALSVLFEEEFSLNTVTDGTTKPLSLQKGILNINNSATSLTLSSGGGNFTIPQTAALILDDGSLSISGNNIGLNLEGKLNINNGTVNIYDASSTNNYIQYYATGKSELNITGGSLRVGSQIRRLTTTSGGTLKYNQSGGTVEIGYSDVPEAGRGVLEVLNNGSEFSFTGGTLTIMNGNASASVPSFYLDLADATIGSTNTLNIGGASGSPQIGIYSLVPIPNLNIVSTGSPTAKMWNIPLEVDGNVTIGNGASLNSDGNQLSIKGNLDNNGTYINNNNTTVFNGTGTQTISGSTSFYNLTKQSTGTLELTSSITVKNDLKIEEGILSDNGYNVRVLNDVLNTGTHVYGGTLGSSTELGIFMNGILQQKISGTGTFGKITVENSSGVTLPVGNSILINNALRLNAGVFDIQGNLLALGLDCIIEGSDFNANKMIQTNTSFTDNGVKKTFKSGASTFVYPVGSLGKYTPVTFTTTANGNSTGTITVKAANEIHPNCVTNDTEDGGCQLIDAENVLQYHWILKSEGISDFISTCTMLGNTADIEVNNTCSLTSSDYIPTRLLSNSILWNKFDETEFDETTATLTFIYGDADNSIGDNSSQISGEYTAGLDLAVPDQVVEYESTGSGDGTWASAASWVSVPPGTPVPSGGPKGSLVHIKAGHTITTQNNGDLYSYRAQIDGTLNIKNTIGHRLGEVSGSGTIRMEDIDNLPAGDYSGDNGFLSSGGGSIEYGGTSDYSVLSNITSLKNVSFTGSGRRILPNIDLNLTGDFIISESGGTLIVDNNFDNNITLQGNLTMTAGTFDAGIGNSKITFTGSNAQTISGNFTTANSSALYNVEINKSSSTVSLGSAIEISKNLTLSSGSIVTTSTNILTLTNHLSTAVTGASATSYINGPLKKYIENGGNFTFPVGLSYYREIGVSATTATTTWTAEYLGTNSNTTIKTGDELINVSAIDRWTVSTPDSDHPSAQITLFWGSNSGVDDIDVMKVAWLNGSNEWESVGGSGTGTTTYGSVTSTTATSFSSNDYAAGSTTDSPLPIELIAFSATANKNDVLLKWTTASEINNDYFEVQRSVDGANFDAIGTVLGMGNNNLETEYSFIDKEPINGIAYYRLKQVDFDGEFKILNIVAIEWINNNASFNADWVSIYPNPYSSGELILALPGINANTAIHLSINNLNGKQIYQANLLSPNNKKLNLIPLAIDQLSKGIYFVTIQTKDYNIAKKLIVN